MIAQFVPKSGQLVKISREGNSLKTRVLSVSVDGQTMILGEAGRFADVLRWKPGLNKWTFQGFELDVVPAEEEYLRS